jgi:hypothetical protein
MCTRWASPTLPRTSARTSGARRPSTSPSFREPQDLKAALDAAPPDVLGLSSYSWNHNLSRSFARYAKARSPKVLTLMGGPNYPLTREEQEGFLRGMPEIDVAVRGPTYEGERAFLEVTPESLDFLEVGITSLLAEPLLESTREQLRSVLDYLRCVLLHVPFVETMAAVPTWTSGYDVESWRRDGYVMPLESYRTHEPQTHATTVAPERQAIIRSRIATFGEHVAGLGKFTRTMFAQELRRTLVLKSGAAEVSAVR